MKIFAFALLIVCSGICASGSSVTCSVIDYLYYSSDCCDSSNTVQCMESIPQTDKAAIDNLASLKRPDGSACKGGDTIKFTADTGSGSSGIVCADEDTCIIACVNGVINGTKSTGCSCVCNLGYSGADCSTVVPCPDCNGGQSSGSVADGNCACDCTGTGKHGPQCLDGPYKFYDTNPIDYTSFTDLTSAECQALWNDHRFDIASDLGVNLTAYEVHHVTASGGAQYASDFSDQSGSTIPRGCSVAHSTSNKQVRFFHNSHSTDYCTSCLGDNKKILLHP